jgi:hypothetical protein
MTDKSEEEKLRSQPATDAGPIEPESQDRTVSDANPKGDRKRADKVARKNGSIATRFKKGCKSPNPKGRPKKVASDPDTGPGDILQAIDNELVVVVVGGKRSWVTKAEAQFLQLFESSSKGDLEAAKLIMGMAVKYFGPEAEGPSEIHWLVMPDSYYSNREAYRRTTGLEKMGRWPGPPPQAIQQPLAAGYLFRKVASQEVAIDVYGTRTKMPRWDAYMRRIYVMALEQNTGAAKLLDQLRKKFPGKALPGAPITMIISEADAML